MLLHPAAVSCLRLLILMMIVSAAGSLHSKDHYLVIAGGYRAASNQVSLEKNVVFFRKVHGEEASEAGLSEYFSSGNAAIRSVQFEPEKAGIPKANEYMARLFGSSRYLNLEYRKHELGKVDGSTSLANLNQWFENEGKALQPGDRLIIYATAHGGKSKDKKKPENTTLYLWNTQSIDVRGLQAKMEKLADGVTVILVMAQCHAGGFAYSIFNEADPEAGDFGPNVCGFFATVASREAAGCTPEINEENYDEFSSHFWAALKGEDRLGKEVESADYDGNGQVSFEEAHAFTVLSSLNIDIPMRTSGAFLRERSQFGDDKDAPNPDLLDQRHSYSKTLALAGAADRVVLEGLSERLKLKGEDRYAAAEKKAAAIEKKRADLLKAFNDKKRAAEGIRNSIRQSLYGKWPELANLLTEQSVRLLNEESEAFVTEVERHPRLAEWVKLEKERSKIDDERYRLEKEWVQFIRFMRAHNNLVLAENLSRLGDSKTLGRFQRIQQAEKGFMAPSQKKAAAGGGKTPAG